MTKHWGPAVKRLEKRREASQGNRRHHQWGKKRTTRMGPESWIKYNKEDKVTWRLRIEHCIGWQRGCWWRNSIFCRVVLVKSWLKWFQEKKVKWKSVGVDNQMNFYLCFVWKRQQRNRDQYTKVYFIGLPWDSNLKMFC